MVDELPDANALLEETDWSHLEHGGGSADPGTPVKLAGLVSGKSDAAAIALDHLWNDLLHQGSLYSATPPAALYVAAVLGESGSRESLAAQHRRRLLEWLAETAYAVSISREQEFDDWFGPGMMARNPLFSEVRAIRPVLFRGVFPHVFDSDEDVAEAALLAAAHLLDAPELADHIGVVSPKVRSVLAVSSKQGYRDAAISRLAAWGEDTASLKDAAGSTKNEDDSWNEFWNSDRGSLDEPPF
ncbi:hypothetical protein P1S61_40765 [Streptomyces sp. ME08-AFT2]|uniref:hypothetical protein n=1 Tax=Streptomyces sp. ME08-AFT2 TaxID=3028683 RepID=UPI0029BAB022|nr:hypothetical protein [Streptomyces sp. ME08-AFT2]MDX3315268.1 hypothetical protein [Streptomyces sp. ME08-AFT2]